MRNLTITVDEEVARWARVWAAHHDTSVSRLVGDLLRQRMADEREYEVAMAEFEGDASIRFTSTEPYPSRAERHDRYLLR